MAFETDSTCDGNRNSELFANRSTLAVNDESKLIKSPRSFALERGLSNTERIRIHISGKVNDFVANDTYLSKDMQRFHF